MDLRAAFLQGSFMAKGRNVKLRCSDCRLMRRREGMLKQLLAGFALAALVGSTACDGKSLAGVTPLTTDEVKQVFVGHTWSGTVSGMPTGWQPQERAVAAQLKGKLVRQFKEYYAPNGSIVGWVSGSAFDGYVDGTWHINGNELCAAYVIHRKWKIGDVRAVGNARWCYAFVFKNGSLLMATTQAPADAGANANVGRYFRPSLSSGNSVFARYNTIRGR